MGARPSAPSSSLNADSTSRARLRTERGTQSSERRPSNTAPRMRGTANVSNLTPRVGVEALDGVDQAEHAGADQVAGVDAVGQAGTDTAGDELHQRRVVHDDAVAGDGVARLEPALPPVRRGRRRVSCSGVRLRVDGAEALVADVGVPLRRGHVGVAEQLLHRAQVGPAIEQVRGEAVTQCVGMGRASADRRSMMRRTSRGDSRTPRSLPNSGDAGVGGDHLVHEPPARRAAPSTAGALSGTRRSLAPLPHTDDGAGRPDRANRRRGRTARRRARRCRTAPRARRRRAAGATRGSSVGVVGAVEQGGHLAVVEHAGQPAVARRGPQRRLLGIDRRRTPATQVARSSDAAPHLAGDAALGELARA